MTNQNRLRGLFTYCPFSGRLIRKNLSSREKSITAGISKQGYLIRWVDGKCYTEHLLVFVSHYGYFPKEIDHKNNNKTDNRIENLRECDRTQNNGNQKKMRANKTSKYKGVSWHSGAKKWLAQIVCSKQHHYLGLFDNEEDAAREYSIAAKTLFGEFANASKH